jgi:signal transduction histidine kinase/ligand-binding sensor domain-containing protein
MQTLRRTLLLLIFFISGLSAQTSGERFSHLTPRDGLSDGFVWAILQDRTGYMYFGTMSGLDRYDGYTIKRFRHDPLEENSIGSGGVFSLLEGNDGTIWVGTGTGLNRFDPVTERFNSIELDASVPEDSLFLNRVDVLHQVSDGSVWAGTRNGVYIIQDREGIEVAHKYHPGNTGDNRLTPVWGIGEDTSGTVWIGTANGLFRYDPDTDSFTSFYHDPDDPGSISSNHIWDIHLDRNGILWLATFGGGLCRFEETDESFHCYRRDPEDPVSISDDGIQSIYEDEYGRFWLGTMESGASIFDPAVGEIINYRYDSANPGSIGEDDVHQVYKDRSGTYWFAHHYAGLSKMTPGQLQFTMILADSDLPATSAENAILSYLDIEDETILLGSVYGIYHNAPDGRMLGHYLPKPDDPPALRENPNAISNILMDNAGHYWVGDFTGNLYVFNPAGETPFRLIKAADADKFIIPHFIDLAGYLWVETLEMGIWKVDPISEEITVYLHVEEESIPIRYFNVLPDTDGTIWGLRFEQNKRPDLFRYDQNKDSFSAIMLTSQQLAELPPNAGYRDSYSFPNDPGSIWITSDIGLYRLDMVHGGIVHFPRARHDLPGTITTLVMDHTGRLWYGGASGQFGVFNPQTGTSTQYYIEDGIRISRFFNSKRLETNELIFSGIGGYIRFHPDELMRGYIPPEVHISSIRIADETILPHADLTGGLELSHDQNTLMFDYVAFHYSDPVRNRFRYTLEGYDDRWMQAGTQRSAIYPRLPHGTYTFRVQAASSEGVWNEEGASIRFTIRPPWWLTWWAYMVYAAFFIGGVVMFDRVQRHRLVKRERERTREKELAQAREIEQAYENLKAAQEQLVQQEKLASLGQLTAGIAHEIKNPLNFVNNFSDVSAEMIDEALDELKREATNGIRQKENIAALLHDIKANLGKIHEHGSRADNIVKSMLLHSRGKSGEKIPTDLNRLLDEYVKLAYHGMRAVDKSFNIDIQTEYDTTIPKMDLVAQDISRAFLNIINNGMYAASEYTRTHNKRKPVLYVRTRRVHNNAEVLIRDNGGGIPDEIRARIFEPFFTTKPTGAGTGLGLSMTYDIVKLHNGNLNVNSQVNEYTEFIVTLPITNGTGG